MPVRKLTLATALCAAVVLANRAAWSAAPAVPPVDGIEKIVSDDLKQGKCASYAVAVVKDGRLMMARGFGYADLENDVPATAETVYRLGSITKQFTAMAILQLVEAGKLSLDDELTKFLPDYPTQDHKVTVRHLLNHTSGIKSYTNVPGFRARMRQDFSHDQLLDVFKKEPFEFAPGEKWNYNNSGYYLLGLIIEKASGQSYADYLQEHIFRPLAMSATRYGDTRPLIRHRAMGYRLEKEQLVNDDPLSMTAPFAAGALVSSVLDLVKWHLALEAGQFISPASYEAMYRPTKLADGKTQAYGFGWAVGEMAGHAKLSHGGGINGFSTMIARYPQDRLAVVVLTNTAGANPGRIEARIARLMLGIEEKPPADLPTDAEKLKPYAGKYAVDSLKVEITVEDGKLYATPAGQPRDRLMYQGGHRFVSSKNPEMTITFQVDAKEDKANDMLVEVEGQKLSGKRTP
jgi:CubicO group peptidase (beta-lactamase class C family)